MLQALTEEETLNVPVGHVICVGQYLTYYGKTHMRAWGEDHCSLWYVFMEGKAAFISFVQNKVRLGETEDLEWFKAWYTYDLGPQEWAKKIELDGMWLWAV